LDKFYEDYNVTQGRYFWGPFSYAKSQTKEVGVYPPRANGSAGVREVQTGLVATEHPSSVLRYNTDKVAGAKWAVDYYKNAAANGRLPEFFEPMNEPFVHADDKVFEAERPSTRAMEQRMADWFAEIGKQFDQTPELANMKVIGYASAWPSLERWNFGHWERYQKMFMDRAGAHMDGFATHLYDGINVTGQSNFRSGSNSEAILDMIEAYSYVKWGEVKPHAITEYGGIERGFGRDYTDLKSAQGIRSFNHMIFNLLERENDMLISIPFVTDKSTWHLTEKNNYQPYGPALFRPKNLGQPNPGGWEYTSKIHFFELWKEFKGKRVAISTDNVDIQAQAFAHENKLYVALNNLDTEVQSVDLNFIDGLDGLENVRVKGIKIYEDKAPVITNKLQNTAPRNFSLIGGETVTLEYTFETIGRKHEMSKTPIIKVNGKQVSIPNNWAGYDQTGRIDFFGTIIVPFSAELLKDKTQRPFNGSPAAIPGNIEIEAFDLGGQDVAYSDIDVANNGGNVFRPNESVDTARAQDGSITVGWTRDSEWLEYTVNAVSGTYDIDLRFATNALGKSVVFKLDDAILGTLELPNTEGGNNFQTVKLPKVKLKGSSESILRLEFFGGGINLDRMQFNTVVLEPETLSCAMLPSEISSSNTLDITVDYSANENRDVVAELWKDGNYLSITKVAVEEGSGKANLSFNFAEALTPSDNYEIKAGIRPTGKTWREDIDNCVKSNVVLAPPPAEVVGCQYIRDNYEVTNALSIPVEYSANETRDVVVEFWNGATYLTENRETVKAGQGVADIALNFPSVLPAGKNYLTKVALRPVGAGWRDGIANCNQLNISMLSCDLPWSGTNMSITQETLNWASQPIDIDCASDVRISAVDGGEKIAISRNTDGFALKNISASNIKGSSLVLYVEGKTSWKDETYNIKNIRVEKMP